MTSLIYGTLTAGDPFTGRTSLTKVVDTATTQNHDLAAVVSTTGSATLQAALDMYQAKMKGTFDTRSGETEEQAHQRTIDNLKDLEEMARSLSKKTEMGTQANLAAAQLKQTGWQRGDTIDGIKMAKGTEALHGAPSQCAVQGNAFIIDNGSRSWSEQVEFTPKPAAPSGWTTLAADLHHTTALLATALMGPTITASVDTLPQSVTSANLASTSNATVDGASDSKGSALLGLAARWGSSADLHGQSDSTTTATYQANTTTADLPIVSMLLDMKDRVEHTSVTPASTMALKGNKSVSETEQYKDHPFLHPNTSRTISVGFVQHEFRNIGTMEDVPAHLSIPERMI